LSRVSFDPARLRGLDFVLAALFAVLTLWVSQEGLLLLDFQEEVLSAAHPISLLALLLSLLPPVVYLAWRGGRVPFELPQKKMAWVLKQYLFFLPVFGLVSVLNLVILRFFELSPFQEIIYGFAGVQSALLPFTLIFVLFFIPFFEEILFRGYLFGWLASRPDYGPKRAIVFSALVFALAHEPQAWLLMALFGALLGWVRWQSGSLRGVIMLHVLHNSLAAITTYGYIWMVNQS
jgi:membrane protease YdiL (CAAX protease family)